MIGFTILKDNNVSVVIRPGKSETSDFEITQKPRAFYRSRPGIGVFNAFKNQTIAIVVHNVTKSDMESELKLFYQRFSSTNASSLKARFTENDFLHPVESSELSFNLHKNEKAILGVRYVDTN